MANPPGNHQQEANHASSSFNGAHLSDGNPKPETSGSCLKHNPVIYLDWTLEEQAILENGLKKFASEPSIIRCAKIALQLQNKTVRDVALRCRWMTERVADTPAKRTHFAAQPNLSPYAPPMIPMDCDDGIPYTKIQENIGLLCQTRDNILKIMNKLSLMPSIMKQMQVLPVKLKEELANTILPRSSHRMFFHDPLPSA
ncbi:Detected protein of unknown function [Hibiscus syriacus]|uniref:Myb-like domain-containing protein n=1 Tax=Hibiscus syriacus TaxID=106335 RepID=A0A6A3CRI1_HIBSY|nr:Detected protein of unknown function [Hibiscus syriacus]